MPNDAALSGEESVNHVSRIAPTFGSQRLELIDSLRGFALAGVLLENLRGLSLFAYLPREARLQMPTAEVDQLLASAFETMITGKFITLFSVLFGIGFSMQLRRIGDSGVLRRCYIRRLSILFLIGLLHALFWRGDILRYYGLLGLVLLPLGRMSAKDLAWLGIAVATVAYPVARILVGDPRLHLADPADAYAAALGALGSSHWPTMLRGNLALTAWSVVRYWNLVFYVAGALLVGAAIGKSDVLVRPADHIAFWRRMFGTMLIPGMVLTLSLQLLDYQSHFALHWRTTEVGAAALSMLRHTANLTLGLAYMAAFTLLFIHRQCRQWLQNLAPMGQMALSNYLLQTVVAVTLFYGVGLSIGPRLGMVGVMLIGILLFAFELGFSRWWLSMFRFGPIEWIWRSVSYEQRQPIKRPVSSRDDQKMMLQSLRGRANPR